MIDHVAYTVEDPYDPTLQHVMNMLGFVRFEADEAYKEAFIRGQYTASWWSDGNDCDVHLVQGDAPAERGLEHLCVMHVGQETYDDLLRTYPELIEHHGTSGRLWLAVCGLRIEVHP